MARVKLTFPAAGNYRYKIETSTDGQRWTLAMDESQSVSTDQIRTEIFTKPVSGHLLRLTFAGPPAALAEVEISGRLTAQ